RSRRPGPPRAADSTGLRRQERSDGARRRRAGSPRRNRRAGRGGDREAPGGGRLNRKDVLDLDDFSADEIEQVMVSAEAMREVLSRPIKRVPPLRGKTIVNLFYEASTRTRISFELAAKNLSADVVNV